MQSAPSSGGRPEAASDLTPVPDAVIIRAFARIDAVALGAALGVAVGLAVAAVTLILLAKGGDVVGPNLQLLGQYFIGYAVTLPGILTGSAYGVVCGFIVGWAGATLRNFFIDVYLYIAKLRARLSSLQDYIDP
jgi:hypothetical protein